MVVQEGIVSEHRWNGRHFYACPYAQRYGGVRGAWLYDPDQCSTLGRANPYLPEVKWIRDDGDAAGLGEANASIILVGYAHHQLQGRERVPPSCHGRPADLVAR